MNKIRKNVIKFKAIKYGWCSAVIVAAGSATRMKGIDKILAPVNGKPVIQYSLETYANCEMIQEVIVVTRADLMDDIRKIVEKNGLTKVKQIVEGGADRTESVLAGLSVVSKHSNLVAIHDGARPFISEEIILATVDAAAKFGAAAPGVPAVDTIKVFENDTVKETLDRNTLTCIQTPQVFDKDLINVVLVQAKEQGSTLTDDCSAVEQIGFPVHIVEGSYDNFKITTPRDLLIAEAVCHKEDSK